jgi:hypothetical protein
MPMKGESMPAEQRLKISQRMRGRRKTHEWIEGHKARVRAYTGAQRLLRKRLQSLCQILQERLELDSPLYQLTCEVWDLASKGLPK